MRIEKNIKNTQGIPRNQRLVNPEDVVSIMSSRNSNNQNNIDFANIDPNKIKITQQMLQKDMGNLSRISAPESTIAQQKPKPNYLILVNGKIEAESQSQEEAESDLEDILRENPEMDRECIEVWQKVGIKVGVFLDI